MSVIGNNLLLVAGKTLRWFQSPWSSVQWTIGYLFFAYSIHGVLAVLSNFQAPGVHSI